MFGWWDEVFPSPILPVGSRAEVFLGYLGYFRNQIIAKVEALTEGERRRRRLPSGWNPHELVKHLIFVDCAGSSGALRAGRRVDDPWGDQRGDRWFVAPRETTEELNQDKVGLATRRPPNCSSWPTPAGPTGPVGAPGSTDCSTASATAMASR